MGYFSVGIRREVERFRSAERGPHLGLISL